MQETDNTIYQDTKGHKEKKLFDCLDTPTARGWANKQRALELLGYKQNCYLLGKNY